jgi:hypothetical protein
MSELSPAAQAVLTAFGKHPIHCDHISNNLMHGSLPAALRAVADQVVPDDGVASSIERIVENRIRRKLLAIAAELEGAGDD